MGQPELWWLGGWGISCWGCLGMGEAGLGQGPMASLAGGKGHLDLAPGCITNMERDCKIMTHVTASNSKENSSTSLPILVDTSRLINGLPSLIKFPFKLLLFFLFLGVGKYVHTTISDMPVFGRSLCWGWDPCHYSVSISPTLLYVVPPSFVVRKLFNKLSVLQEDCSTCRCRFIVSTRGGEFKIFLYRYRNRNYIWTILLYVIFFHSSVNNDLDYSHLLISK